MSAAHRATPALALGLAAGLTALSVPARAAAYTFTNFDAPVPSGTFSMGTTVNGLSNTGALVGFSQDSSGNLDNFVRNPDGTYTELDGSLMSATAASANGVNSAGTVVGMDGNAAGTTFAFSLAGGTETTLPFDGGLMPTAAFGINDAGLITGQLSDGSGFIDNAGTYTNIAIPTGFTSINVQGINDKGLAVGFYTLGDVSHGFTYNYNTSIFTTLADPVDPYVNTNDFLFSQVLGINDAGIAAGYFGTTTDLQHGFLYNTKTGQYTYLDDPSIVPGGSALMQITGINNGGELSGFYSDAADAPHGFFANPNAVPEPSPLALLALGALPLALRSRRRTHRQGAQEKAR